MHQLLSNIRFSIHQCSCGRILPCEFKNHPTMTSSTGPLATQETLPSLDASLVVGPKVIPLCNLPNHFKLPPEKVNLVSDLLNSEFLQPSTLEELEKINSRLSEFIATLQHENRNLSLQLMKLSHQNHATLTHTSASHADSAKIASLQEQNQLLELQRFWKQYHELCEMYTHQVEDNKNTIFQQNHLASQLKKITQKLNLVEKENKYLRESIARHRLGLSTS
eukprot:Sdes_comp16167_c0_seq1m5414